MTILAVDTGTSEVKAALIGDDGATIASASVSVPETASTDERVDPERYWEVVAEAMRAVAGSGAPDAITVTGQGDGFWALDSSGEPCGAYQWNSTKAAEIVQDWEDEGVIDEHYRSSTTILWSGTSAAIWRWLEANKPDEAKQVSSVFCAKDWINYRLCGVIATDVTDATIPFLDLGSGDYNDEIFARLGCENLRNKVAAIHPVGEQIGVLGREAALAVGAAQGTPILMGCIDVAAMVHGSGLQEPDAALLALGTTVATLVIADTADCSGQAAGATLKLPGADRFLRVLGTSSGTSTLDWCLQVLGYEGERRFERFWGDVADGVPGPLLLPYLAGERAPFLAPEATGAFLGLTLGTRRADLARAAAVGVTFSLRHCLESARRRQVGTTVLTGGGSSEPAWCQLVADVTGIAVAADRQGASTCEGVARLVTGGSVTNTDRFVIYEPRRSHYAEYQSFIELVRLMRPVWAAAADHLATIDD